MCWNLNAILWEMRLFWVEKPCCSISTISFFLKFFFHFWVLANPLVQAWRTNWNNLHFFLTFKNLLDLSLLVSYWIVQMKTLVDYFREKFIFYVLTKDKNCGMIICIIVKKFINKINLISRIMIFIYDYIELLVKMTFSFFFINNLSSLTSFYCNSLIFEKIMYYYLV